MFLHLTMAIKSLFLHSKWLMLMWSRITRFRCLRFARYCPRHLEQSSVNGKATGRGSYCVFLILVRHTSVVSHLSPWFHREYSTTLPVRPPMSEQPSGTTTRNSFRRHQLLAGHTLLAVQITWAVSSLRKEKPGCCIAD